MAIDWIENKTLKHIQNCKKKNLWKCERDVMWFFFLVESETIPWKKQTFLNEHTNH